MNWQKKALINFIVAVFIIQFVKAQQPAHPNEYPKIKGFMSLVHPLVTINKDETVFNFSDAYTVGFPCGINILKSDKLGFSFELVPFIRITDSISKVNNLLFHPGVMFRYPHDFTFITRLAFETSGRFGTTAVFNKIIFKSKMLNYFMALSLPARFGNNRPASIGLALQLGISY